MQGFEVCSALDGEEGFKKAVEEQPDLILTDIVLPKKTGVELCLLLKDIPATKDIPIILVTASGMRNLEERCQIFGAVSCVSKPYQISDLVDKIQRSLTANAS